jgi:hypothetical protein
MNIQSLLGQLFAIEVVNRGVEKINNEIKFENFIGQGKEVGFLKLISNCKHTAYGMSYIVDPIHIESAYLDLYDYLVKKGIIKSKFGPETLITADQVHIVNPDKSLLKPENIKKLINPTNSDYPALLKCYHIDYNKLSNYLINYEHASLNQFKVIKGGKSLWGNLLSRKYVFKNKNGLPKTKKYKKIFDAFKKDKGVKTVFTHKRSVAAKNKTNKSILNK